MCLRQDLAFCVLSSCFYNMDFPGDSDGKESTCNAEDVGKILWEREWQPMARISPVFLHGKFQGQWGHKELDRTE